MMDAFTYRDLNILGLSQLDLEPLQKFGVDLGLVVFSDYGFDW